MATTIKLKSGSGAPLAGDLVAAEPAFDLTNKRLYTEDSGGTVIEVGTNPGTDVTFADNRKAIFGAGSDLQIYHDGSNSYIEDVNATTDLIIRSYNRLQLKDKAADEMFINCKSNDAVELYHDGAFKFSTTSTGIDVTGTVTSDGLTVEGATLLGNGVNSTHLTLTGTASRGLTISTTNPGGQNDAGVIYNAQDTAGGGVGTHQFQVAGSTKLIIDSSGNVGIGVSSLVTGSSRRVLQVSTGSDGGQIAFADSTTEAANPRIFATNKSDLKLASANSGSSTIQFITGTTPAEAMRIDSSGNLLVGKDSATATDLGAQIESDGQIKTTSNGQSSLTLNRKTSDGSIAIFQKDGTTVGSISVTASATAYNTSSDQRLKENIVDAPAGNIDDIRVRSFDWKADGSHQKYGMVAQELVIVAPEVVTQPDDPEEMMGVDYSKLVPMMIKEIQDLRARVAQLEGA